MKPQTQVAVIIISLGFAFAVYEFWDFYSHDIPQMQREVAAKQAELQKQQAQLKKLQDFAQNIESIKQELRELNLELETALEHMPRNYNLSGLLRKLSMLAQNSGLDLSNFKPSSAEKREKGNFYATMDLSFTLHGSFTQTLTFLDQVSRLKRIVSIDHLSMGKGSDREGRGGAVDLKTTADAHTYRFAD